MRYRDETDTFLIVLNLIWLAVIVADFTFVLSAAFCFANSMSP